MTHLLLDLDTVEHVFDKGNRSSDFVMAGIRFAEKLLEHEECIEDFDTKNEMETRCVPLYGKIVILKYKNAGMDEEAKKLFTKLTSMSFSGKVNTYAAGEAVRWDHWQHTPQIWVNGLRSQTVWPRETWGDLPICKQLEDNFATLREEAEKAVKDPTEMASKMPTASCMRRASGTISCFTTTKSSRKSARLSFPRCVLSSSSGCHRSLVSHGYRIKASRPW